MKAIVSILGAAVMLLGYCSSISIAQVADAGKDKVCFLLSPDGRQLAYGISSYNERAQKVTQIMVCRPDGAEKQMLQTVPGHCDEVLWNGSDHLICSAGNGTDFTVIPVNGGQSDTIHFPSGYDVLYKRISPDGRYAAFVGGFQKDSEEKRSGGLFVFEFSTGHVRCLIDKYLKTAPAWSPDSKKIAIANAEGYVRNYPLLIVDIETGQAAETGIEGVGASWSPDGGALAFSSKIVRGGSWMHGIPVDGQIAVYDPADKNLIYVTPSAVNNYDKDTGKQEIMGCLYPVWSADGKWIAYCKIEKFREKKGDKLRSMEATWIVKKDGQNPLKVADGYHPLAWSKDGQLLYILKETQIDRVDLKSLKTQTVTSWENVSAPQPRSTDTLTLKEPGVVVTLTWIDKAYGRAFAKILSEAKKEYASTFKFTPPETLELDAKYDPDGKLRLWTDGQSCLYLVINSKSQLAPPDKSGVFNIYGLCHEIGHIALSSRMKNLAGLPGGVGEGWAHYAGSAVVEEVSRKLGNDIWPQPYDIAAVEGMTRLKRQVEGRDWQELDERMRAAKVFYETEKKYGRGTVAEVLNKALSGKPGGNELMPLFVRSLREVTADPAAGNWIPPEILVSQIKWNVKERNVSSDFFSDTRMLNDKTGVVLYYDDGTKENRHSTAGSGHAVLFQKPRGDWHLDRIDIFGSRYGTNIAPKEEFTIYICDEDFNVVCEFDRPYGLFKKGNDRWHRINIEPTAVPERFYVCLNFNPTATKGVYVGSDENVTRSHSRSGLPYTFVADTDGKYDWMIRSHLRDVSQSKTQK